MFINYRNATIYLDANINTMHRKRVASKRLPNEHKPYVIVYPPGSVDYKLKNRVIHGAQSTIEGLVQTVSDMIPDTVQPIRSDQLENEILKSLHERKLAM